MTSRSLELVAALQRRLPNAKVFWEKAPDPFFDKNQCILAAVSLAKPVNKVTMVFTNGLGEHPIEEDIDAFITYLANELLK